MTSARWIVVGGALAAATATFVQEARAAQADSTPLDSTLTSRSGSFARTTLRGSAFRTFFADDPEHLLVLVPGVVLRRAETGLAGASALSIRGGAFGEASVYIDGARTSIRLGSSSLADVSVRTGAPDLGLPDFSNGIIEYQTQSGGPRLSGSLRAATDEAFPGVGFNRFDGSIGGPVPGLPHVTFFVGGTVTGQREHYVGLGSQNVPSYVPGGIDTVVTITNGGTTRDVPLSRFVDHRAYDWGTDFRAHAKVAATLPSGTMVSVTGVANELQERFFPGMFALAPSLYTGSRAGARLVVANWRQLVGAFAGQSLWLHVRGSLGSNEATAGLLEAESQIASRDPALGITLETLRFTGADMLPNPVTDQLIRNMRTNSGLRVPLLNRDELRNAQTSRGNPYGMQGSWLEQGLDGTISLSAERSTEARVALEWGAPAGHRVTVGADVGKVDVSRYTASLLRQSFMDVYRSKPGRVGIHVSDSFERDKVRAEIALRSDHFGSVGLFPTVPGRIYSNPAFNRPAAVNTDTGYANSLARVMTPGRTHNAVSFRAAGQYDLNPRTTVRAVIGSWVERPPLELVLAGSNNDLDFTNTNDVFGRDVDYGQAFLAEVGARVGITQGIAADVALYRQTRPSYVFTIQSFTDPANPGDVFNINSLVKVDGRVDWGSELALDWNVGSWATSRVAYALRLSNSAAPSGPFTLNSWKPFATHAFAVAAVARAPEGVLRGLEGSLLLRLTSGMPYTLLDPQGGTGALAVRSELGSLLNAVGPINGSRLPWIKNLDVRLTKAMQVGRQELAAFADFRNVMNFRNILNLFAETGDVVNANFRAQQLDVEFQNLETEAANNSRLLPNGDIDLVPSCASWTIGLGAQSNGPVLNCVAMRRAEARFGNGDGLYSLAERTTALNAFFDSLYGPQTFYGAGRSVRLGVEIRW